MKKKILLTFFTIIIFCLSSYSQVNNTLSIKDIRQHVNSLASSMKSDGQLDNMYVKIDDNGDRWIYIENKQLDGFRSDEGYVSLGLSEVLITMIYHSINYNMEKPISLKSFTDILLSKSIKGVQFRTKNNDFFFDWDEIIEKSKTK